MSRLASIKSTKLRLWISGLLGVVMFAPISASTEAAPISITTGLARDHPLPIAKVAQRQHHHSRVHNSHLGFHGWHSSFGAAGDDPPNPRSDWYPHDSNELPFGSARWWWQMQDEYGGGGR